MIVRLWRQVAAATFFDEPFGVGRGFAPANPYGTEHFRSMHQACDYLCHCEPARLSGVAIRSLCSVSIWGSKGMRIATSPLLGGSSQ